MDLTPWRIEGRYLESCNCDAVCPCRMVGGALGGRSTHGECFGLLSWHIDRGHAGALDLGGLSVALACRYHDDEPGSPWAIVLYVDAEGDGHRRDALEAIFLGAAGGKRVLRLPWVRKQRKLLGVRTARIQFDDDAVTVEDRAAIRVKEAVKAQGDVRCLIPGYEEDGEELYASVLAVHDDPFGYTLMGNCAYRSEFHYCS